MQRQGVSVFSAGVRPAPWRRKVLLRRCSALRSGSRRSYATDSATPARGSLLTLLEQRGYIQSIAGSRDALSRRLARGPVGVYVGIDPTAPALHIGHLLPLMVLFWMYAHGHRTVSLIGSFTARLGDPSGRLITRQTHDEDTHSANSRGMLGSVHALWRNVKAALARHGYRGDEGWENSNLWVQDNAGWMPNELPQMVRDLGPGMRLGPMLGKDTVKNKMDKGDGMSWIEFSYPLFQAWDWWHMYQEHRVEIQIGGSDQFGNITAGMDAVQYLLKAQQRQQQRWENIIARNPQELKDNPDYYRLPTQETFLDYAGPSHQTSQSEAEEEAQRMTTSVPTPKRKHLRASQKSALSSFFGLTTPLLTTAGGAKFGKTAGNAVWLDDKETTAFDLYGFLLRTADADIERYLKLFTFLPLSSIAEALDEHASYPERRFAQHLLAKEVLTMVHGLPRAEATSLAHRRLFASDEAVAPTTARSLASSTTGSSLVDLRSNAPDATLTEAQVLGKDLTRVLHAAGLVQSRSAAHHLLRAGGVYVGCHETDEPSPSPAPVAAGGGGQSIGIRFTKMPPLDVKVTESFLLQEDLLAVRFGKSKVRLIRVVRAAREGD